MARPKKPAPVQKPIATTADLQKVQAIIPQLSLEELVSLKADIERQITPKQREHNKALYADMLKLAKAAGFASVEAFVASHKSRRDKGVKMPPKYQNGDGNKTWTGQGRRPDWVLEHLKDGGVMEDLEIS